jgi:hypothetical protein
MERLFTLDDAERSHLMSTREYLALLYGSHRHLRRKLSEMTQLFEEACYGSAQCWMPDLTGYAAYIAKYISPFECIWSNNKLLERPQMLRAERAHFSGTYGEEAQTAAHTAATVRTQEGA